MLLGDELRLCGYGREDTGVEYVGLSGQTMRALSNVLVLVQTFCPWVFYSMFKFVRRHTIL